MKRTIKITVVAALALGTTSAFATNGSTLIGLGAKSRGMAGTSIGISHGAESALSNPALITGIQTKHEISFGGTLFMPDVKTSLGDEKENSSAADLSVIPEVSIATKVNENFYWGIGMWGTAGMGVDYRDVNNATQARNNYKMVTNLQLMQFGVPLAYKNNNLSVAIAPILQYGALDINYYNNGGGDNEVGEGVSQDLAFGYSVGIAYSIADFTIGAVYKSEIEMEYQGQLTSAMAGFGQPYTNDKLSTPAEYGLGISYTLEAHTIALDYKKIVWSSATGYEDFQWDDQNVFAIGYAYKSKDWAIRLGYNYASDPISDQKALGNIGYALNTFNLLGFPATIESHYAIGGSYSFDKVTSIDFAFTYAPEVSTTLKGADSYGMFDVTTKHSQSALTLQLNYGF